MKIIAELKNINGNTADVYIGGVMLLSCWAFSSLPKAMEEQKTAPDKVLMTVDTTKITELAKSGIAPADIVEMYKAGML